MQITKEQLRFIYPFCPSPRIDIFLPFLQQAALRYRIYDTVQRLRMFLAQVGHESAQLRYTEELASGSAYEDRKDLGNLTPGDGVRYKGRGLIQVTGRANYEKCGLALGLDLLNNPTKLAEYEPAAMSAGWYWDSHGLNSLCDSGDFETLTKRINGGLNGYANRLVLLERAEQVIK